MASGESLTKYKKTPEPAVVSKEYKGVLKEIKSKKLQIEEAETLLNKLTADFKELDVSVAGNADISIEDCEEPVLDPSSSSATLRTLIRTPGGTKRKGNLLMP